MHVPRGVAIRGCGGVPPPPIFSLSAHLPKINSAHINNSKINSIADKYHGKSYFSANWVGTKSVCGQLGVVHPTKSFLLLRPCMCPLFECFMHPFFQLYFSMRVCCCESVVTNCIKLQIVSKTIAFSDKSV